MILVIGAAVVLVVGVAVVAAAVGLGRDAGPRAQRTGVGALLAAAPVAVGALVVVAVVGVVGLGGLRRSASEGAQSPVPAADDEQRPRGRERRAPLSGPPASFDALVDVRGLGGGEGTQGNLRPLPVVDRREVGDVVEVRGRDFDPGASGAIGQCGSMAARRCRNLAPVVADDAGHVRAAYRLEGPASGSVLLVEIAGQRAVASLVFGAPAPPPPRVRLDPSRVLSIDGGAPRSLVIVARCAADARALDDGCHARQMVRLDDSGRGRVRIEPRRDDGLVVVAAESESVLTEPVFMSGIRRSEVRLEASRTLAGVVVALFLLGMAAFIIRTTDWRPPSEASTPFLDAATSDA